MDSAGEFIIAFASRKIEKVYNCLPEEERKRIDNALSYIRKNPFHSVSKHIRKLKGKYKGSYRWDINSLRIIYDIDNLNRVIYVKVIEHRGQAYK